MKPKVLVVNGERYWQDYFPDCEVIRKKIQDTTWVYRKGKLWVADKDGTISPDAVLWRVGAIPPSGKQTVALDMIALSGVACSNPVASLKKGYDRLSMLHELQEAGLPVLPFEVISDTKAASNVSLDFPFVLKAGNYHGGYGKMLIKNEASWKDAMSVLYLTDTYCTAEPFVDYEEDIRYIVVGETIMAMTRKGKGWKANVDTQSFKIVGTEKGLKTKVLGLKSGLGADILAVDFVKDKQGNSFALEYNDIPGLSGFPQSLRGILAKTLRKRMNI